ncbi:MAG: hypothetical protein ACRDNZ_16570 [Streptosporangiaceae bacterium]
MDGENHPDPFGEGMAHGLHRAMQVASCAATAAQVVIYQHKAQARVAAERDDLARRALQQQLRASREAVRAGWAPALDAQWLRRAGLFRVAQVWGAAVPYADPDTAWHEPTATVALRRCEDQLRELHPYAMAFYDRLRTDGAGPAEAMGATAPLFARYPRPYDASSVPRLALDAGPGTGLEWVADAPAPKTAGDATEPDALERRGREIVAGLQAQAAERGREPLGAGELRTVLEATTNLPDEVISRLSGAPRARSRSGGRKGRHAASRRGTQPWGQDFPTPIGDVVALAPRTTATRVAEPASPKPDKQPNPRRPRP